MTLTLEQAVGQHFLLSFYGTTAPDPAVVAALERQHIGGIVLFRASNIGTLCELRGLTAELQHRASATGQPPLLIATDQEGGQLMAIGEGTPFPGNLALGATTSEELSFKVGHALGREVAAVGVNVDFAPVCDVNNNPANPVVGTRSFGGDPLLVSRLGAAQATGLQDAGVAATAKHFPGHGDTASDSHHGLSVIPHDERRVREIELPPFQAAVDAGVKLVMTAHIAFPALDEGRHRPATLSAAILKGLLRSKLGFEGLIVTDAMDMKAIRQDEGLLEDTVNAIAAGVDLLLFNLPLERLTPAVEAVLAAVKSGRLSEKEVFASAHRIIKLKQWAQQQPQPPLDVVGCDEHQALALEVARRSVTVVRDQGSQLPLRPGPDQRLAVLVPRPEDLTPADTSSYVVPELAAALGRYHDRVDAYEMSMNPEQAEVAELGERLAAYDLVVVGTINATVFPGQAALVNGLLDRQVCLITVALRMPYDLAAYPGAPTFVCSYSILPPAMTALAEVLWGRIEPLGTLPVTIPHRL